MYRSGLPDYKEYEANRMAAEILMTKSAVRSLWASGVRSIAMLAQNFAASEAAVRIRLKQLGLAA
jgi:Zn-dependent peptidase ImmA (M78 family)